MTKIYTILLKCTDPNNEWFTDDGTVVAFDDMSESTTDMQKAISHAREMSRRHPSMHYQVIEHEPKVIAVYCNEELL